MGNGATAETEAPASGESRRKQRLPQPTATAPAVDSTLGWATTGTPAPAEAPTEEADMSETEDKYWSNFKAISLSVCMALRRANQAHLTGNLLILASFSARMVPPNTGCECNDLRQQLIEIEEEHLHALGQDKGPG